MTDENMFDKIMNSLKEEEELTQVAKAAEGIFTAQEQMVNLANSLAIFYNNLIKNEVPDNYAYALTYGMLNSMLGNSPIK